MRVDNKRFFRLLCRGFLTALALAIVCWTSGHAIVADDQAPMSPANMPVETTVQREIRYRDGTSKQWMLDLAMPKERGDKPRAAIVVIHGGGWVEGDKSSFSTADNRVPGNIIDFARLGFVAITINYRLSGEAPFPAALDDCRCAVRWLRANADKYHIDPARIGAYGMACCRVVAPHSCRVARH